MRAEYMQWVDDVVGETLNYPYGGCPGLSSPDGMVDWFVGDVLGRVSDLRDEMERVVAGAAMMLRSDSGFLRNSVLMRGFFRSRIGIDAVVEKFRSYVFDALGWELLENLFERTDLLRKTLRMDGVITLPVGWCLRFWADGVKKLNYSCPDRGELLGRLTDLRGWKSPDGYFRGLDDFVSDVRGVAVALDGALGMGGVLK